MKGPAVENPYTMHADLQTVMGDLVGIIRREDEIADAIVKLEGLKARAKNVTVEGTRVFNPGWHLALDLEEHAGDLRGVAKAALIRQESRGGHTRDDYPGMNPEWRKINLICRIDGEGVDVQKQPIPTIPDDLLGLFDIAELKKYLTEDELTGLPREATDELHGHVQGLARRRLTAANSRTTRWR